MYVVLHKILAWENHHYQTDKFKETFHVFTSNIWSNLPVVYTSKQKSNLIIHMFWITILPRRDFDFNVTVKKKWNLSLFIAFVNIVN